MLKLGGRHIEFSQMLQPVETFVIKITTNPTTLIPLRSALAYLSKNPDEELPSGFKVYLGFEPPKDKNLPWVHLPSDYKYIDDGDVVRLNPSQNSVRVLYRKNSAHNGFLTTERCNNYCLMCSQPPKTEDDSWIVDEILQTIPLMDRETKEIGLTGGEPTLLGGDFFKILRSIKSYLPDTSIHVLSNGRNFQSPEFAEKVADVQHHDLVIGIPLYADVSHIHDYVVQADGAFDETIRGILNLKRYGQKVEIRVVLHKQTIDRLPQLAEFLARNLIFVDHVALMGLEMMGFTRANLENLWIDPFDYQKELKEAVRILSAYRMNVSVYNHQLCLLDKEVWPYARKSISDWKNEYMPECEGCEVKEQCGGFFSSAYLKYSDHIQPQKVQ